MIFQDTYYLKAFIEIIICALVIILVSYLRISEMKKNKRKKRKKGKKR